MFSVGSFIKVHTRLLGLPRKLCNAKSTLKHVKSNVSESSVATFIDSVENPNKENRDFVRIKDILTADKLNTGINLRTKNEVKEGHDDKLIDMLKPSIDWTHMTVDKAIQTLEDLHSIRNSKKEKQSPGIIKHNSLECLRYLTENEKKLSCKQLLNVFYHSLKTDNAQAQHIKAICDSRLDLFDANQLPQYILTIREHSLDKDLAKYYSLISQKFNEITEVRSILYAMRVFNKDKIALQVLNTKILDMKSKLTPNNWIEVLERKSIQRDRDLALLHTCIYQLNNQPTLTFNLLDIQKCLLSIGCLKIIDDDTFLKRLTNDLKIYLEKAIADPSQRIEPTLLTSCIKSIGILSLRDESTLNLLCDLLIARKDTKYALSAVELCKSCANCNIVPKNFDKLTNSIKTNHFKSFKTDPVLFLNYVWSLCVLKQDDLDLIKIVFQDQFLADIEKKSKDSITDSLKLLQTNLYALINFEDYDCPDVSVRIDIMKDKDKISVSSDSIARQLELMLSSFLTKNLFYKTQLLQPYGVTFDAFLIVDKNGMPQPLENFYDDKTKNYEVDSENYLKIALKFVDFNSYTLIDKKINGFKKFQFELLKYLDYVPVPITYDELAKFHSLTSRIELLKNKLKIYATNPDFKTFD